MRHQAIHFKTEYLANQTPETIFQNRICFSQHGLRVRRMVAKQNAKREAKRSRPHTAIGCSRQSPSTLETGTSRPSTAPSPEAGRAILATPLAGKTRPSTASPLMSTASPGVGRSPAAERGGSAQVRAVRGLQHTLKHSLDR